MMTDLALVDSLVASHPQAYARAFKILTGFKIGAAVKQGNTELIDAIDNGLQVLQANGEQNAIFAKYKIDPGMKLPIAVMTK